MQSNQSRKKHIELSTLVSDFALGLRIADGRRPQAINRRTKELYRPGIGPHAESRTVELVLDELVVQCPERYGDHSLNVPYVNSPKQKCDLCLGREPTWIWSIEIKMLRFLGDNGKLNDNILMHILSPYSAHRSALTDCEKLCVSDMGARKGIIIYGFDHEAWHLDPAIEAFEVLARRRVALGPQCVAKFEGLVHPIHSRGRVFGWEVLPSKRGE